MQVFNGVQDLKNQLAGGPKVGNPSEEGAHRSSVGLGASVVTIGNFDGVHGGHRELIETLVREAHFLKVPSVVYTFDPHPVKVLHPERKTERLFDLRDQQEQFEKMGVDYVVLERFTPEFARVSAQDFLQNYLFEVLAPQTLVVGHDFSFGAQRQGDLHFLEKFCSQHHVKLIIIPPFEQDGQVVSSSRIRAHLQKGEVEKVAELLGRSYYLRGHVEKGFQRGRTIGVPTANVHPDVEFIPRQGVYVTSTFFGGKAHASITNIGINPTFALDKRNPIKIESHLFDFDKQIYGLEVQVHLLHFLRDEKKFSGIEELKNQIQKDLQEARKYFDEHPQDS